MGSSILSTVRMQLKGPRPSNCRRFPLDETSIGYQQYQYVGRKAALWYRNNALGMAVKQFVSCSQHNTKPAVESEHSNSNLRGAQGRLRQSAAAMFYPMASSCSMSVFNNGLAT